MIELQWIINGEQRTLQYRVTRMDNYGRGIVWSEWMDIPEIYERTEIEGNIL